jgi:5'-deoxynucleotidase YfbR-like HD superfamily hydrolase
MSDCFQHITPELIMALGEVRRWHTRPVRRDQTVADHSAQVALLALYLDPSLSSGEQLQVLAWGLLHDAHETVYGDIPGPAKTAMAEIGLDVDSSCQDLFWGKDRNPARIIEDHLLDLVHVADVLEAALFARKHLSQIADVVRGQAEKQIRARLSGLSVPFSRAMAALGVA